MGLTPPLTTNLYKPLAWVFPYLMDWGISSTEVESFKAYTTALRWWNFPSDRALMVRGMLDNANEDNRTLPDQAQRNVDDLMSHSTWVGAHHHPKPFRRFLILLDRGDFVTGVHVEDPPDDPISRIRPGYAFLVRAWRAARVPGDPPWPFWIFPKGRDAVEPV